MDKSSRRFFIGLPVDDESSVRSLRGVFGKLNQYESLLKTVPPENYHITVKFLGSVGPELAESLTNAFISLNQLQKVEYKLEGVGSFPSIDNPAVIWAGMRCEEKPLARIFQSVEDLASAFGFPKENRKFIPHLTLARIKKEKPVPSEFKKYLIQEKHTHFAASVFTELVLFESILKNTGPDYKKIEVIKLI